MGRQGAVRGVGGISGRRLKFRGRLVMVMERVLEKVRALSSVSLQTYVYLRAEFGSLLRAVSSVSLKACFYLRACGFLLRAVLLCSLQAYISLLYAVSLIYFLRASLLQGSRWFQPCRHLSLWPGGGDGCGRMEEVGHSTGKRMLAGIGS